MIPASAIPPTPLPARITAIAALLTTLVAPALATAADDQLVRRLRVMGACEHCDLAGVDLERYGLAGARLNGANLRGARLRGADLSGAQLRGAILDEADLRDAKLRGADLRGARLIGTDLTGATLERANLGRARILRATLRDAKLDGANVTALDLQGSDLRGVDMQKFRLDGVILRGVNLAGANLEKLFYRAGDLSGADLGGAILDGADLQKTALNGANLAAAAMSRANLSDASLRNAVLRNAVLAGATLARANLNGADLTGARLAGADLGAAQLVKARLAGAQLVGARLVGAAMAAAYLAGADLTGAIAADALAVGADFSASDLTRADFSRANLGAAVFADARLAETVFRAADLRFAKFAGARLDGTIFSGSDLRGAKIGADQLAGADTGGAKLDRALQAALGTAARPAGDVADPEGHATQSARPDPIPEAIEKTGLAVELADFAQIPASSTERPLARLNWLSHAGDGSGRLFAVDMRGKVHVVKEGRVLPEPFLDLAAVRGSNFYVDDSLNETGLSSIAFHPDFAKPGQPGYGLLYTVHTETRDAPAGVREPRVFNSPIEQVRHRDVLSEWRIDPRNPDRVAPESQREILRIRQPHSWHNMGLIAFNPNARPGSSDYGMMYIGSGDGGDTLYTGVIDFHRTAQNPADPFAAILRIDPLADGRFPYAVPLDNPFIGKPGHLPEIWAHGFRNPQRFSWDTGGTGRMIIADVGQALVEEVNLGVAGANYGWSEREGTFVLDHANQDRYAALAPDDARHGYTYPVAQYDHGEGAAISGGFVYRGAAIPDLRGMYVFGDLVKGRLFYLPVDELRFGSQAKIGELTLYHRGRPTTLLEILGGDSRADLRFGIDEAGEIYITTKRDGMIRMLRPAPAHHTAR